MSDVIQPIIPGNPIKNGRACVLVFETGDNDQHLDPVPNQYVDSGVMQARLTDRFDEVSYYTCCSSQPTSSISGDYNATTADSLILSDASSGPLTVTLPPAADSAGSSFFIKKTDASTNVVNVSSPDTIDGLVTQTITLQYDVLNPVSDGTAWFLV